MTKVAIFKEGILLPNYDGATTRIVSLARMLVMHGVEVVFFHCDRGWSDKKLIALEPFTTYLLPPEIYYSPAKLRTYVEREAPDIVQGNDPEFIMTTASKLTCRHQPKIVFEAHNSDFTLLQRLGYPLEKIRLMQFKEYCAATISEKTVCVSRIDAQIYQSLGIPSKKIAVVPNGVSLPADQAIIKNRNDDLVFLGNTYYQPNAEAIEVIYNQILPKLEEKLPCSKVIVIGPVSKQMIRSYTTKNLIFTGAISQEEMLLRLTKARIGLCPLKSGSGTRLKVLQYLTAGLPTISTKLGIEGLELDNAVIIEDDFSKYADRIIELLNDTNQLERLRRTGLQAIRNKYDWNVIAKKLKQIYWEIS